MGLNSAFKGLIATFVFAHLQNNLEKNRLVYIIYLQDRQCTHNVTLRRVRIFIVAVERQ